MPNSGLSSHLPHGPLSVPCDLHPCCLDELWCPDSVLFNTVSSTALGDLHGPPNTPSGCLPVSPFCQNCVAQGRRCLFMETVRSKWPIRQQNENRCQNSNTRENYWLTKCPNLYWSLCISWVPLNLTCPRTIATLGLSRRGVKWLGQVKFLGFWTSKNEECYVPLLCMLFTIRRKIPFTSFEALREISSN